MNRETTIEILAIVNAESEHAPPAPAWDPLPAPQKVVHVVGRATDEVLSFLRSSLQACAAHGFETCVVLIDKQEHRHCLVQLDQSAELFLVAPARNPLSQWRAVARTIDSLLHADKPHAVHLHGLLPCAVGVLALHRAGIGVPVYFSLHGFRTLNALGMSAARVLSALRKIFQKAPPAPITYVPQEKHALQIWSDSGMPFATETPAQGLTGRHEAAHPLIISGGHGQGFRGIETFSQLAVLLSGGETHIGFEWIGPVSANEARHLSAAGVRVLGADDHDHALHLTTSWLYAGVEETAGFPVALLSAMAMGLPCVALDCDQHRAVITHGETGYLCGGIEDFLDCISMLLDDAALRARIGSAAREQAVQRFNAESFGRRLFAAYSLSSMAPNGLSLKGQS